MSPFVSAQAFAPPNSTLVYQVLAPEIVWDFLEGKKTSCTRPPAPLPICRRRAYSPAVSGIQWGAACIQPMFPRTCGDAESDLAVRKNSAPSWRGILGQACPHRCSGAFSLLRSCGWVARTWLHSTVEKQQKKCEKAEAVPQVSGCRMKDRRQETRRQKTRSYKKLQESKSNKINR